MQGVPDLVVEVLSPSTRARDLGVQFVSGLTSKIRSLPFALFKQVSYGLRGLYPRL